MFMLNGTEDNNNQSTYGNIVSLLCAQMYHVNTRD